VVLQAEAGDVVAESEQKMIAAIVAGAEQCAGLHHQVLVMLDLIVGQFDGAITVAGDVQVVAGSKSIVR